MHILLTGGHSSLNNGEVAMVVSTVHMLRTHLGDAHFTIYSRRPQVDSHRYAAVFEGDDRISVVGLASRPLRVISLLLFPLSAWLQFLIKRLTGRNSTWPLAWTSALAAFGQADLVVDLSGDAITDDYGLASTVIRSMYLLTALFLQKPTVIFAQSMGPFRSNLTEGLARYILNHVDLILVRERVTFDLAVQLGAPKDRLFLTADSAFVLPKHCSERVRAISARLKKPLVGIGMSRLASKWAPAQGGGQELRYLSFAELVAQFVDALIQEMDCYVLLTPHRYGPGEENDDRVTLQQILDRMTRQDRVTLPTECLTAMEIKALIGECDLFVGARMHTNIAALSQGVPTVAISYSHKTRGIMELLGMQEWVYDIRDFELGDLFCLCQKAFSQRTETRASLEDRLPAVVEGAWLNAHMVSNLVSQDPTRFRPDGQ